MGRWTIFGETLAPGELRRTVLRIAMDGLPNRGALRPGEEKTGDYEMPVFLFNGAKEGKTLLISAGIHSGEYAGTPAVIRAGRELLRADRSAVRFRELTEREIAAYIASGEPMDKAGAYGAQGKAALFVERIDGDFFNVMGLPLCMLGQMLKEQGVELL